MAPQSQFRAYGVRGANPFALEAQAPPFARPEVAVDNDEAYWGKHTYGERRQIVVIYRVRDRIPGETGKQFHIETTYYLDYESLDDSRMALFGKEPDGDTYTVSEYRDVEGVFLLEQAAREHFEGGREKMLEDMKKFEHGDGHLR